MRGKVKFVKLDTERYPSIASQYSIGGEWALVCRVLRGSTAERCAAHLPCGVSRLRRCSQGGAAACEIWSALLKTRPSRSCPAASLTRLPTTPASPRVCSAAHPDSLQERQASGSHRGSLDGRPAEAGGQPGAAFQGAEARSLGYVTCSRGRLLRCRFLPGALPRSPAACRPFSTRRPSPLAAAELLPQPITSSSSRSAAAPPVSRAVVAPHRQQQRPGLSRCLVHSLHVHTGSRSDGSDVASVGGQRCLRSACEQASAS